MPVRRLQVSELKKQDMMDSVTAAKIKSKLDI